MISEEIVKNSYIGVIEDITDEDFEGRCKIRVFGVHHDLKGSLGSIPTEDLPYAYPLREIKFSSATGSGQFSTPRVGTKVRVFFEGGDPYQPRYYSIEEIDEELKGRLADDYKYFNSLLYDSDQQLKIFYAVKTGLLIELKESYVNIDPESAIILYHKDGSAIIEMRGNDIDVIAEAGVNISSKNTIIANSNYVHINGANTDVGANPIYSNVNGEMLIACLAILATGLDAKFPTSPGKFADVVNQFAQKILSGTVKTTP